MGGQFQSLVGAVDPGIANANFLRRASFTLTAAQLKSLAVPLAVLPAAPSGLRYVIMGVHWKYTAGGVVFGNVAGNPLILVYTGSSSVVAQCDPTGGTLVSQATIDLTSATSNESYGVGASAGAPDLTTDALGKGVSIETPIAGNYTNGTGTLTLTLYFVLL